MPSYVVEAQKKCFHNSRLQEPGDHFTISVSKKADLPEYVKVIEQAKDDSESQGKKSKPKKSEEGSEASTLHEMNEKKPSTTVKSPAASDAEG